ncbi:helix-turn-helix transcriptional regulator [Daejeonella lutea]|uniref:Regulatory protein, luxR family n=1 Tax=Daejeonella lutea TaxID=572036 RepID=A0A1T5DWP8_9SPHI|nr:LuxR family transcriptional regulator [Daejeonella lutea]SKB76055.1 regulatory protein, luxR family [Daejeonella lutea]
MVEQDIQNLIDDHIAKVASFAELLPGVTIIHDLRDWSVAWMSDRGIKELGICLEEIVNLTTEEYHARFFNEQDAKDYAPKVFQLMEKNSFDDMVAFFQQVRFSGKSDWMWHMTAMKILAHDPKGKPLLSITIAFPIDPMHAMTLKASRLLKENNFLRKNLPSYAKLSKREREILKLLALGKSAPESAEELFISIHTVQTHIKNIRKKLDTNSYYDLCEYARAFDLI